MLLSNEHEMAREEAKCQHAAELAVSEGLHAVSQERESLRQELVDVKALLAASEMEGERLRKELMDANARHAGELADAQGLQAALAEACAKWQAGGSS